jgi:hypothetical protein
MIGFHSESSPQLVQMIKEWQLLMMGNKYASGIEQVLITLDQIKYKVTEKLLIITACYGIFALINKRSRNLGAIFVFLFYIFILVFNYSQWFLPLSELLYPERVCFYFVVGLSLIAVLGFDDSNLKLKIPVGIVTTVSILLVFYLSINSSISSPNQQSPAAKQALQSFEWINKNCESNAVFSTVYDDFGMWIPAYCNRPTIGTHIHFIHVVKHINDTLLNSSSPKYVYTASNKRVEDDKLLKSYKDLNVVYTNGSISIYKVMK